MERKVDTSRTHYNGDEQRPLRVTRTVLLHGVPLGPGPRGVLILVSIRLVHVRDLRDQRVVRVRIRQQGADGQQHLKASQHSPGEFVGSSSHRMY